MSPGRSEPAFDDSLFASVAQAAQKSAFTSSAMPRAAEQARLGSTRAEFQRKRQLQEQQQRATQVREDVPDWAGGGRSTYTSGMQALRDYVTSKWGITDVGGFADRNIAGTNKKSDHALHRAWDFMVGNDRAKGDAIADYVTRNHDQYGVKNLIWYDRIWDPQRGWRPYGHPGGGRSDTLQHRDHPHVGFN